jgi:hypothetical protein
MNVSPPLCAKRGAGRGPSETECAQTRVPDKHPLPGRWRVAGLPHRGSGSRVPMPLRAIEMSSD